MESGILCLFTSALCLFTWATGSTIAPGNITRTEDNVCSTRNDSIAKDYRSEVQKCWDIFDNRMNRTFHDHWCKWESVVRFYNDLQTCLECSAEILSLAYPNDLAHYTILNAHLKFFINCAVPEEFMDPPENVLLALIFAPICIIPFLVTLVVYKSNTSKPQT